MSRNILTLICLLFLIPSFAQKTYKDSINLFLNNYVDSHEVVQGDDRKYLRFFDVDEQYRVVARLQPAQKADWFQMNTSGRMKKIFRVYGILSFTIHDTLLHLNLYQSQDLMQTDKYKYLLFLPFTDATTGNETYESGRYIDLDSRDIKDNKVVLDFNKAYNPYCAYVSGRFNCPVPPRENHLNFAIRAGEMAYGKHEQGQ